MGNNVYAKRREIEREISKLKLKEIELKMQKRELIEDCNHEILIRTMKKESENTLISFIPPRKYCLLCGKDFSIHKYSEKYMDKLEKSVLIDMNEYPKLVEKWEDSFYSRIENMYKIEKKDKDDISEYEIG